MTLMMMKMMNSSRSNLGSKPSTYYSVNPINSYAKYMFGSCWTYLYFWELHTKPKWWGIRDGNGVWKQGKMCSCHSTMAYKKLSWLFGVKNDTECNVIKCKNLECKFKCRVSLRKRNSKWVIGTIDGPHTCISCSMSQDHRKLD